MPGCPRCKSFYPDGTLVCPTDGTRLVDDAMLSGRTMAAVTPPKMTPSGVGRASSIATDKTSFTPQPVLQSPTNPPVVALGVPSLEPVFAELKAGQQVGEYVIERKLGEGGMAMVYAGVHPLIGKRVAIKVLSPSLAAEPDIVRRFIQEARSVNQIGHRHIVDIFSFGRLPDGRHYFVMELLDGQALTKRLADRKKPLEWREAIDACIQVCSAIGAAHQRGIVHRDLKPDNLYLVHSPDGDYVKVLDFGIAKLTGEGPDIKRTATGIPMGTPIYMSPEQTAGKGVDHRTDVYALGIMMYEIICGIPPFDSDNYVEILHAHLAKPPPPLPKNCEANPELEALVMKMIAKRPDERPSTMEAVRTELARLRDAAVQSGQPLFVRPAGGVPSGENRQVSTPPPIGTERVDPRPAPMRAGPRGTPVYVAVIVLLAAGVGGVVAYGKWGGSKPQPQPVVQPTPPPVEQPHPQPQPTPPPKEEPKFGRIKLTLHPQDAKVSILVNNTIMTEPELQKLDPGFKVVEIQAAGYEKSEYKFRLDADMEYPLDVTLKKAHGGGHPTKKSPTKNVGDEPPPPPQPLDRNGTIKVDVGPSK
jgi:serine/threonine-protein kinase